MHEGCGAVRSVVDLRASLAKSTLALGAREVPIPRNGASHRAPGLHIELLGGFRITVGSTVIEENDWRLRKARNLVKLLALAPSHRLHREQVTELLWPDLEPGAADNNLRYALHVARRTLANVAPGGRGYLKLQGHLLVLCPAGPLRIDVEVFEAAAAAARGSKDPSAYRAAIERYTGDLLPEDRYEDWAADRRESLRQLDVGLLLELAGLHETCGEWEPAIDALRLVLVRGAKPLSQAGQWTWPIWSVTR